MVEGSCKQVSHYKIEEKLGEGQFGTVFAGKDLRNGETRAIKMINNSKLQSNQQKQALHREIQIMRNLNHKNIVKLFDDFETIKNQYLILEYCSGGDLSSKKGCGEHQTVKYLRQIISGLKVLQSNQIIHRDLKPANILLSDSSPGADVKLADFGLSRQINAESLAKTYVGTPLYMAPEVMNVRYNKGERYTDRADIWSIGCISYELITGTRPYKADNLNELLYVLKETISSKNFLTPENFSPVCRDFLSKIFILEPQNRISFEELCEHRFISGEVSPIIELESLYQKFEPSSKEEALETADVLYHLAKEVPHPFLFYLKNCMLLESFLDDSQCARAFKLNFAEAKKTKNKTDWESTSTTREILEKAVQLCRSDAHVAPHLLKENYRQALALVNSLPVSNHVLRLKEAISKQIASIM